MYQPDSQGRLKIPDELLKVIPYEIKNETCAICIDIERREMYILPTEELSEEDKVLTLRIIDSKGRLFIKSIKKLFGNSEEYLIYLQDEKIWIRGY